jgi:hypothetical protein
MLYALNNQPVVPKNQASVLYYLSWFSLISGITGILYRYFFLGSIVCIGSAIAQKYWKDPRFNWWRLFDIAWVIMMTFLHGLTAFNSTRNILYFSIQLIGILFYILGWVAAIKNYNWIGTLCHAMVHVCANVSIIILYVSPRIES